MSAEEPRSHIPLGSDRELYDQIQEWISESGAAGGPTSLTDLTDVTGAAGPKLSPVGDHSGMFPLTAVPTQEDLDLILAQVVWHKVHAFDALWEPSNPSVVMNNDGVAFGPYVDGKAAGGSLRYHGLDGQPFSAVTNLAYNMRYLDDEMVLLDIGASPYCRIFTQDAVSAAHDAAFTPGSQVYRGLGPGPMQEFVATAGMWRYDADDGTGGVPLTELQAQYGDHIITKITITLGFTDGTNLNGLLRWWQINGNHFVFGTQ